MGGLVLPGPGGRVEGQEQVEYCSITWAREQGRGPGAGGLQALSYLGGPVLPGPGGRVEGQDQVEYWH